MSQPEGDNVPVASPAQSHPSLEDAFEQWLVSKLSSIESLQQQIFDTLQQLVSSDRVHNSYVYTCAETQATPLASENQSAGPSSTCAETQATPLASENQSP
eukprot:4148876-Amphidinium_carterae.1